MEASPTIHATCVSIGDTGILIRGPSGSGKSSLALRLILDPPRILSPARLVADDRVRLEARDGLLVATTPPELAGLIEVRHLGIRRLAHQPQAVVRLVIDLSAADAARLPGDEESWTACRGIRLFRIAAPPGADPALLLAAALETEKF